MFVAKAVYNFPTTKVLIAYLHDSTNFLTDYYGGRFLRVRGAAKVMIHLIFGLIAITATQLFRLMEREKNR